MFFVSPQEALKTCAWCWFSCFWSRFPSTHPSLSFSFRVLVERRAERLLPPNPQPRGRLNRIYERLSGGACVSCLCGSCFVFLVPSKRMNHKHPFDSLHRQRERTLLTLSHIGRWVDRRKSPRSTLLGGRLRTTSSLSRR